MLVEPLGRLQRLLAAVLVEVDVRRSSSVLGMVEQLGRLLDQGRHLGPGRMSRGGLGVNQGDQLHDGAKRIARDRLLVLVLGAQLQAAVAAVLVDLDFDLARLQQRMLGRIGGDGEQLLMVEPVPARRLAQRRQSFLQRRVELQALGHLRLPGLFDGAQHRPAIGGERRGASLGDDRLVELREHRAVEIAQRLPAGAGLRRLPAQGVAQLGGQEVALVAVEVQAAHPDQADLRGRGRQVLGDLRQLVLGRQRQRGAGLGRRDERRDLGGIVLRLDLANILDLVSGRSAGRLGRRITQELIGELIVVVAIHSPRR